MSDDDICALPGDILYRRKFPAVHLGVYLGNGLVLHNNPKNGEHVSTLSGFADGREIKVNKIPDQLRSCVLSQANKIISLPKGYNVLFNNCEHTVNKAVFGTKRSDQVKVFMSLLLLCLGYLALRK